MEINVKKKEKNRKIKLRRGLSYYLEYWKLFKCRYEGVGRLRYIYIIYDDVDIIIDVYIKYVVIFRIKIFVKLSWK